MNSNIFYIFGWWTRTGVKAFNYSVISVALVSLFFILLLSNFPGEEQSSNWRYLAAEITLLTEMEWSRAYSSVSTFLFRVFFLTAICTVIYRCIKSDLVNGFLTNRVEQPITSFMETKVSLPVNKWLESRSPLFTKIVFYVSLSFLFVGIVFLAQVNVSEIDSKNKFPLDSNIEIPERIKNEVIVRLPNGELVKGSATYSMDGNVLSIKFFDKKNDSEDSLNRFIKE